MIPKSEAAVLIAVIRAYTGNYYERDLRNTIWPDTYLGGRLTIKANKAGDKIKLDVTINP